MLFKILIVLFILVLYRQITHYISYTLIKNKILKSQKWDLNICCGITNGKGINADIVKHKDLRNFKLVKNIYKLPFKDKEFENVLCSHTMEHVDDPDKFFKELKRVGKKVVIVLPPMWDIFACFFNIFEHKWIFLCLRKKHTKLPFHIRMPFARLYYKLFGQKIHVS